MIVEKSTSQNFAISVEPLGYKISENTNSTIVSECYRGFATHLPKGSDKNASCFVSNQYN